MWWVTWRGMGGMGKPPEVPTPGVLVHGGSVFSSDPDSLFSKAMYRTGVNQPQKGDVTTPVERWKFDCGGETQGAVVADIDGDGSYEVITYGLQSYQIHCLNPDGSVKWTYTHDTYILPAAVFDVDGDGEKEIITVGNESYIRCLSASGTVKWSAGTGDVTLYGGVAVLVGDVDGDGNVEVLGGDADGKYYCLSGSDGSLKWSYTGPSATHCYSAAMCKTEGETRILVMAGEWLACLDGEGTELWVVTSVGGVAVDGNGVSLWDVDEDGDPEVIAGFATDYGNVCIYSLDGTLEHQWDTGTNKYTIPAWDIDEDGTVEILLAGAAVSCYTPDGTLKWEASIPGDVTRGCNDNPVLGDIDRDGYWEVLVGTYGTNECVAYEHDGTLKWRFATGDNVADWVVLPTPFDIDEDGSTEILVPSEDYYIYCLGS